jgi:hypothetical protein
MNKKKQALCFTFRDKESHRLMKLCFNIMDFAEELRTWTGTEKYDGVKPVNEV